MGKSSTNIQNELDLQRRRGTPIPNLLEVLPVFNCMAQLIHHDIRPITGEWISFCPFGSIWLERNSLHFGLTVSADG
jgi:hypothetical protein